MLFFMFGWMDTLIVLKWFQTPDVYDETPVPWTNDAGV